MIDDFVSGKLELHNGWEKRRNALGTSDKPEREMMGDLTELACEFLVREATDAEVIRYVRETHPDFWKEKFSRPMPSPTNDPAARFNAFRLASGGYFL